MLYGQRYWKDEFGLEDGVGYLWEPDVFGYSGGLPQVITTRAHLDTSRCALALPGRTEEMMSNLVSCAGGSSLSGAAADSARLWGRKTSRESLWEHSDYISHSTIMCRLMGDRGSFQDIMMTQKLSWNTINFFPHHSFWW